MRLQLAAALAALTFAAPALAWPSATVTGSGTKVTQPRTVGPFDAVKLRGSVDVAITVGPAQSVQVTVDDNLQPKLLTRLDGSTLVVEFDGDVSYHGTARVDVTVPALRSAGIEGSGDLSVRGGSGDQRLAISGSGDLKWSGQGGVVVVALSGSGDVKLEGKAARLEVSVAGSGDVDARELQAGSAKVSVAGSGDVAVTLDGGTLEASVAGSGDVTWAGTGSVERASVAGSGEVRRR